MRPALLLLALVGGLARAGQADDVYRLTAHGRTDAGVSRTAASPRGHCLQCHVRQLSPGGTPAALFTANDNGLCFTCHQAGTASGTYGGQALYLTSAHWSSGRMLWPGPTPAARDAGSQGLCLNCHTPHGGKDGLGLIPDLGQVREEGLCLACHDSTGPSLKNILSEVQKRKAHDPRVTSGRHLPGESSPAAFATGAARHVECPDCHNPHRAIGPDGGAPAILAGASRVRFAWDGGTPFTFLTNGDGSSPVREYEICFKCHSSWTTLDAGAKDKASEFDPRAGSFHPVVAPGTNPNTTIMNANLAGGLGLPHLTTTSVIECQDCHASDSMPLLVTSVSSYVGAVPRGPHGSNIDPATGYSGAMLRARYRVSGSKPTSSSLPADAELCFICHSSAFSSSTTKFTPKNHHKTEALCNACHGDVHGARGGPKAGQANNARLINGANITSWSPGSCTPTCHGNETY